MELSRFWKLRNVFFAVKKRLGLSADGAWAPYRVPAFAREFGGPSRAVRRLAAAKHAAGVRSRADA